MNYAKCWDGGPAPYYPVVMVLVMLAVVFFVWKSLRPPRPPDWWHKQRE